MVNSKFNSKLKEINIEMKGIKEAMETLR